MRFFRMFIRVRTKLLPYSNKSFMKSNVFVKMLAATLAAAFMVSSATAQFIYNNGVTPVSPSTILSVTNSQIVGQEIAPNFGSTPYLDNFTFEYYSASNFAPNSVSFKVQFFYNTGPAYNGYLTPSTKFFDSGWIGLVSPQDLNNGVVATWNLQWQDIYGGAPDINNPSPYTPALAMNTQLQLPSNFTVVFSFSGISSLNTFGFQLFNPPAVGTNYGDYWVNNGTELSPNWGLYTNSVGSSALGMQLVGSPDPVPEPSVIAMGVVGGLLMAHMIRRRRQS
jgi:hypothetical protein